MLAERGQLQLSDPITAWLPAFAATPVGTQGAAPQRPATVHDLLRHTAGFTYEFLGDGPVQQAYRAARLWDRDRSAAEFC